MNTALQFCSKHTYKGNEKMCHKRFCKREKLFVRYKHI